MHEIAGIAVVAGSGAIALVTATLLKPRLPAVGTDVLVGLAGAGLGVGALLIQHDVRAPEWFLAPAVLALAAVIHVRVLFAGTGPLRT